MRSPGRQGRSGPPAFPSSELSDLSAVDGYISRHQWESGQDPSSHLRNSNDSTTVGARSSVELGLSSPKQKLLGTSPTRSNPITSTESSGRLDTGDDLASKGAEDMTAIDKRIMALQSFLENARSGIFENEDSMG